MKRITPINPTINPAGRAMLGNSGDGIACLSTTTLSNVGPYAVSSKLTNLSSVDADGAIRLGTTTVVHPKLLG